MHGLKNDVILRSSKDPDMKIDWSMFNAVERLKIKKNSDGSIVDVRETYPWNFRRSTFVFAERYTWTWEYMLTCASLYIYCAYVIKRVIFCVSEKGWWLRHHDFRSLDPEMGACQFKQTHGPSVERIYVKQTDEHCHTCNVTETSITVQIVLKIDLWLLVFF